MEVPEQVHGSFINANIADNTVISWKTRRGEMRSIRKSAIADIQEVKPTRYVALPEYAEGKETPEQKKTTVRRVTEELIRLGFLTQEQAKRLLG